MNPIDLLVSLLQLKLFDYLRSLWGNQPWVEVVLDILGILIVSTFCLLIVIFLIWLERKVIARMQDRLGPNRVGPFGLLQTVADVAKLLTKEAITPAGADKAAYNLAPLLIVMAALLMWAVVPFAPGVLGTNINIGIFYVLSVSSVSVVCILLAGWGSNNKYALLGAFRAVAQLVSYEVPMILALLVPILLARSMATDDLIAAQNIPFLIFAPLAAVIFFISALAETGRTPFDLLEAESEIVAGFHIEYGGMKFGMFFLAEFINTLFMSALFTTVFLGGYRFFGLEQQADWGRTIGLVIFFIKVFLIYFVFIWIRSTFPRIRVDQLLKFNWKFLVPLTLFVLLVTALIDKFIPVTMAEWERAGIHLALNVIIAIATLQILAANARRQRASREAVRMARLGIEPQVEEVEESHDHEHHVHTVPAHD